MAEGKETSTSKRSWFKLFSRGQHVTASETPVNVITDELWAGMATSSPLDTRISKLHIFENILETKQLERKDIEKVWMETKDLLRLNMPVHARSAYFEFLKRLVTHQYRQLGMLKPMLYQELKAYSSNEDVSSIMLIVDALSDHGKNLSSLEHEIGQHLVTWMDQLGGHEVYLTLLMNIIKFNSSHLDRDMIRGIVYHLCKHCSTSACIQELQSLLKVLDAIICYNSFPQECLFDVTLTLCRSLNNKEICDESWKLMKNLLGTHLGHSCVGMMCQILESDPHEDFSVLRSAVFFLGMSLWGSKSVNSLIYNPQSILPSFQYSLKTKNPEVGYEIALTCQRLVRKFGHDLHVSAWDSILKFIPLLLDICDNKSQTEKQVKRTTHELLTLVEQLYETQVFNGSVERLFEIVESCLSDRPTESVLLLLVYRSQSIKPGKGNWVSTLLCFVDKYYNVEMDQEVRLKTLEILSGITKNNIGVYEKDLLDTIVIPLFQTVSTETCLTVQENAIEFILEVCLLSNTIRCIRLLQFLKPFVQLKKSYANIGTKTFSSTERALHGLSKIFLKKLHSPYAHHAIEAYHLLINFLEQYYDNQMLVSKPSVLCSIRKETLETLFKIRANSNLLVKFNMKSSASFVSCFGAETDSDSILNKLSFKHNTQKYASLHLPYKNAFSCILHCLEKENYWPILDVALASLCDLLDNKFLILSASSVQLDNFAEVMTSLLSNATRNSMFVCTPEGFKRADFQSATLCALTTFTSYHQYLSISRQRQIIRCLEAGFLTGCAKKCICAVTLCMIDMKSDALVRILPAVLLHLSHMTATVHFASNVLELLSSLSQLPDLYSNFVEEQYMSIFAIALQHANPTKFSLYIVALAHHVISMWFVKCRLSFRPDFVKYIVRNLQNVYHNNSDDSSLQHSLIESCIDVMARYTFSNSIPVVKNSLQINNVAKNNQVASWIFSNRIVTIKTGKCTNSNDIALFSCKDNSQVQQQETLQAPDVDLSLNVTTARKISAEAPGKLQSTSENNNCSSRHRHQSSGAVLKHHDSLTVDNSLNECTKTDQTRTTNENSLNLTMTGTDWAEIYIRRPSGDACFLLFGHQLNLMPSATEQTLGITSEMLGMDDSKVGKPFHSELENLNEPLPFTIPANEMYNNVEKKEKSVATRSRSHTVSSSQDYAQRAAARAVTKAKNRSKLALSNSGTAIAYSDIGQDNSTVTGITPSSMFLQLFQSAIMARGVQRPLLLPNTATIDRAVHVLDLIPPYDTWSTGIAYVQPGQGDDGRTILCNEHGSQRYQEFLHSLGQIVSLADCDMSHTHLGGLDQSGEDGNFTYVWQETIFQMVFHVATLMPNRGTDVTFKQRHIGNDYVTVVYDDNSPSKYVPGCIVKGQFLSIEIIISPLELGFNSVKVVYHKPDLKNMLQICEKRTVSDTRLGLLVKQLALHANMAALAYHHQRTPERFVSKALSRLKQIKRIRSRAIQEMACKDESFAEKYNSSSQSSSYVLEEFSDYV